MPEGSYNVSQLLRELGVKNVTEMPVLQDIVPVIPLSTMRNVVPLHQGPVALFGGNLTSVLAEFCTLEIVSLDPGGCIIQWFRDASLVIYEIERLAAPVVWAASGPLVVPAQNFGTTDLMSVVNRGTIAAISPGLPAMTAGFDAIQAPLFLPRGARARITNVVPNSPFSSNLCLAGVMASQAEE